MISLYNSTRNKVIPAYSYRGVTFDVYSDASDFQARDLKIKAELYYRMQNEVLYKKAGTKRQGPHLNLTGGIPARPIFRFSFDGYLQSLLKFDVINEYNNSIYNANNSMIEFYIRFIEEYRDAAGNINEYDSLTTPTWLAVNTAKQIYESQEVQAAYVMRPKIVATLPEFNGASNIANFLTDRPSTIKQKPGESTELSFICAGANNGILGRIIVTKGDGSQSDNYNIIEEDFEQPPGYGSGTSWDNEIEPYTSHNKFKMQAVSVNVIPEEFRGFEDVGEWECSLNSERSLVTTPRLLSGKTLRFISRRTSNNILNNNPSNITLVAEALFKGNWIRIATVTYTDQDFKETTVSIASGYQYIRFRVKPPGDVGSTPFLEDYNVKLAFITITQLYTFNPNNYKRLIFNIRDIFEEDDIKAEVWIHDIYTNHAISNKFTILNDRICTKNKTRFFWLNSRGGFDDYTFTADISIKNKVQKTEFRREPDNNAKSRGNSTLYVSSNDEVTVYSQFEGPEVVRNLIEIYDSPEVYIVENFKLIPVIIEGTGQDYEETGRIKQVKLTYTRAVEKLIQNG